MNAAAKIPGSSALMFSGKRVNLFAPRIDTFDANDIATALSRIPMYRGATWGYVGYSVAQHSTLVCVEVARREGSLPALYALLHHAAQAFVKAGDAADNLLAAMHGAFDLDWPAPRGMNAAIAQAHVCVEMTEKRQLLKGCEADIAALERQGARPLQRMIKPLTSDNARKQFLDQLRINAVAAQLPAHAMPAMGGCW